MGWGITEPPELPQTRFPRSGCIFFSICTDHTELRWSVSESACFHRALQEEASYSSRQATVERVGGYLPGALQPLTGSWSCGAINIKFSNSGTDHVSPVCSVQFSVHTGSASHGLLLQSGPPCPHPRLSPSSDSMEVQAF